MFYAGIVVIFRQKWKIEMKMAMEIEMEMETELESGPSHSGVHKKMVYEHV